MPAVPSTAAAGSFDRTAPHRQITRKPTTTPGGRGGRESLVALRAMLACRNRTILPKILPRARLARALAMWAASLPLPAIGSRLGTTRSESLRFSRSTVDPFSDREIELTKTFANQAVIAIENARLFEAGQERTRELSESLEQQTATSEVLQVISSSPGELQPVFDAILVRICESQNGWLRIPRGDQTQAHGVDRVPLL
jgi:hypothetical protein